MTRSKAKGRSGGRSPPAAPKTPPTPASRPPSAGAAPPRKAAPSGLSAPPAAGPIDYEVLGFKCGLEIHQQLATGKLFCRCQGIVADPESVERLQVWEISRVLRPSASELGELDPAALAESRRGRRFRYVGIRGASCLVEADEEPPHAVDPEALRIALTMAALLGARPADEVEVMRKIVIDGSNTAGFQRTGLAATGGRVEGIPVETICLEEDSARKLSEANDAEGRRTVTYTLDRLGIPLIEIATGPQIANAQQAKAVAARLGALLRATGRVRRGIGTIRQDLNVSIREGDRVEVKGVQELKAVPRVIENEVRRQEHLVWVMKALAARGVTTRQIEDPEVQDVTGLFREAGSQVIQGALKREGKVLALPMAGFADLIRSAREGGPRLGRELAAYAARDAGVKGIFHSDELPAYGVTDAEVAAVRERLKLGPQDAFALSAEREGVAQAALEAVRRRAALALEGVPREVRNAEPDDSTSYLRPLPGSARMYPETDVPPAVVTPERWSEVRESLPELPEEAEKRLAAQHGVSADIAAQLVASGEHPAFEALVAGGSDASLVARALLQDLPAAADADALEPLRVRLREVLGAVGQGTFAKEAVPEVLKVLAQEPGLSVEAAASKAGVTSVDDGAVEAICRRIVEERRDLVKEKGPAALGPLMGLVMRQLRGRADGQVISAALSKAIREMKGRERG